MFEVSGTKLLFNPPPPPHTLPFYKYVVKDSRLFCIEVKYSPPLKYIMSLNLLIALILKTKLYPQNPYSFPNLPD